MFQLATPITCARPVSDFDDISTILTHSSLTGSKKAAPWQQFVGEDGHLFYVELPQTKSTQNISCQRSDSSSTCALCSTRSCRSCASEDTGYSSDTDGHLNRKLEQSVLDIGHDPWLGHPKVPDLDESDDGVSVDLLDVDKTDQKHADNHFHCNDEDLEHILSKHSVNQPKICNTHHRTVNCTRTASLCERHSNKLCVPRKSISVEHKTCKCRGQQTPMSQSVGKQQGVHKEVILYLRSTGHSWDYGSKITWLESVLGIVPGHVENHISQSQCDTNSDKVVIKCLTPGGVAAKNKNLLIGDYIDTINGKQVTWTNLHRVLSSLHQTKKVRLGTVRLSFLSHQTGSVSDRLLLDTGSVLKALQNSLSAPSTSSRSRRRTEGLEGVCVMYMSMEGVRSEEREKEDLVYHFPKESEDLCRLRGSFYTLHHLLSGDSRMDTDVRMFTVTVNGLAVNVVCHSEGREMLIVTAPANRLQASQLLTVSKGIVQLLRFLYGSANQAFSSEHHHSSLDDFFSFAFTALQQGFRRESTLLQASLLGYMDYLQLPEDVVASIGSTLTEFESADFADMSDSFYGCRRAFTILGSVVFYKGRITCCHLPTVDVGDVGLYLHHSGLIDLSTRHSMHQVLVWREVFPNRLCHEVAGINSVFGYSEPHARWFLMVVGVKNTLLACILEAGGCSTQLEGICLPDPFYVDQARAALVHLQTPDIISACEIRLSGDGLPATTTADKMVSARSAMESSHRTLDTFLKTTSSLASSLGNSHFISGVSALSNNTLISNNGMAKEWKHSSIESDGSSGSGSSIEGNFKGNGKKGRLYPVSLPTSAYKHSFILDSDVSTCKLTLGKQNSLLLLCQMNGQEGVLITSPSDKKTGTGERSLHQQVMKNFEHCVSQMHADFSSSADSKVCLGKGVLEDVQRCDNWNRCREEGVMFTCTLNNRTDSKRSPHSLVYWVVGRKFRNLHSREVYVCFPESTPQNIIDLAFRLNLGSLPSA